MKKERKDMARNARISAEPNLMAAPEKEGTKTSREANLAKWGGNDDLHQGHCRN